MRFPGVMNGTDLTVNAGGLGMVAGVGGAMDVMSGWHGN
jgi:hypothetical protein